MVLDSRLRGKDGGAGRALYRARLLENLARDLSARNLKGLDARTLADCRLLFQVYPQIRGTVSPEFDQSLARIPPGPNTKSSRTLPRRDSAPSIRGTVDPEFRSGRLPLSIRGPLDPESVAVQSTRNTKPTEKRPRELTPELVMRFSWTQLLELVRIEDPWKRAFYENECLKGGWSKRQLQRQIESLLYERTGLSTNKRVVVRRAHRQEKRETIEDLIRDPYVLEFAGLAERPAYSESELESALLDHLQRYGSRHSRAGGNPGLSEIHVDALEPRIPFTSYRRSGFPPARE